jgi:hypothetical protein
MGRRVMSADKGDFDKRKGHSDECEFVPPSASLLADDGGGGNKTDDEQVEKVWKESVKWKMV